MKKALCILLSGLLLVSLAACSGGKSIVSSRLDAGSPAKAAAPTDAPAEETADSASLTDETPAVEETAVQAPAIAGTPEVEEQVLVDQDGVRITLTGFEEDDFWGPCFLILVENNTDQNITATVDWACVNGYMVYASLYAKVTPGNKSNERLSFTTSDLEETGIQTITEMILGIKVYDSDTYDDIFTTDAITIHTSLYGSYTQVYDDSGEVLYDQGGVRIISKGMGHDDIWGHYARFYIENNSGRYITISNEDTAVNGFMVNGFLYVRILPGMRAIDELSFSDSTLEENGITSVDTIEVNFRIYDSNTYDTIANTESFTLSA